MSDQSPKPANLDLMSIETVSALLGVSRHTLATMRMRGDGPPFVKVGRNVRYKSSDMADWTDSQTCVNTSGLKPADDARLKPADGNSRKPKP